MLDNLHLCPETKEIIGYALGDRGIKLSIC